MTGSVALDQCRVDWLVKSNVRRPGGKQSPVRDLSEFFKLLGPLPHHFMVKQGCSFLLSITAPWSGEFKSRVTSLNLEKIRSQAKCLTFLYAGGWFEAAFNMA